jgi:hypothetical protein
VFKDNVVADLKVLGRTLFNTCILVQPNNTFSTPPVVLPDAYIDSVNVEANRMLAELGFRY